MATAASPDTKKQFSSIAECSACRETFRDPRLLPCIHTYCLKCIGGFSKDRIPGSEVACPFCSKNFEIPDGGISSLPKNVFVQRLIDIASPTSTKCQGCSEDGSEQSHAKLAVKFCVECSERLCENCVGIHRRVKALQKHELVELSGDGGSMEEVLKLKTIYCDKHTDRPLELYCFECEKVICLMCFVEMHKLHECLDVKKVAGEFQNLMTSDIENMRETVVSCRKLIKRRTKSQIKFNTKMDAFEKEICARVDKLTQLIDVEKTNLLKELSAVMAERNEQMNNVVGAIEQHVSFVESMITYTEQLRDKGTASDVAQQTNVLHSRVGELMKMDVIHQAINDLNSEDVMFTPASLPSQSTGSSVVGKIHKKIIQGKDTKNKKNKKKDVKNKGQSQQQSTDMHAHIVQVDPKVSVVTPVASVPMLQTTVVTPVDSVPMLQTTVVSPEIQTDVVVEVALNDGPITNADDEGSAIVEDAEAQKLDLKYKYAEEQWSPWNPEGKKQYDREFLMQLQYASLSRQKPANLPPLPDIIFNELIGPQAGISKYRSIQLGLVAPYFTPGYVKSSGSGSKRGPAVQRNKSKSPTLKHVIPSDGRPVVGLTFINNELFVLRHPSKEEIQVYETATFTQQRTVRVAGLRDDGWGCKTLTSCDVNNCLFVCDHCSVYKVDLSTNNVINWQVDRPTGLSVNDAGHVIVTFYYVNEIREYEQTGQLIRTINLQELQVTYPWHAVQLNESMFIVSHHRPVHGVSLIDTRGRVTSTYSKSESSLLLKEPQPPQQLSFPQHLKVVKNGSFLVADCYNNRVVALDASLKNARELILPIDGGLNRPGSLYFNESLRQLFAGEDIGQRVVICDNIKL